MVMNNAGGGRATTQLELGITPLTVPIRENLKVAFFVDVARPGRRKNMGFSRRRREVHIGVVKLFSGSGVVIEGITLPGIYNRAADKLFEVHKDMRLEAFE